VEGSSLTLPYYSSPAPLGEPSEVAVAVIVVHGSERNAWPWAVKEVICTPPYLLCMENHQWNIQGRMEMTW
jgi:hypothetical protein